MPKMKLILTFNDIYKAVTTIEASEAIASLKIPSFFLINDLQRCLVYPFMVICLSSIKLF
jgi:hypothetical protein